MWKMIIIIIRRLQFFYDKLLLVTSDILQQLPGIILWVIKRKWDSTTQT